MKIDLNALRDKVEAAVPTARATTVPEINQVIVSFTNRPNVELSLLTPSQQVLLKSNEISAEDLAELLLSIKRIANYQSC